MRPFMQVYVKLVHHFLFLHCMPELWKECVALLTLLTAYPMTQSPELPTLGLLLAAAAMLFLESGGQAGHDPHPVKSPVTVEGSADRYLVVAVCFCDASTRYLVLCVTVWSAADAAPVAQGAVILAPCRTDSRRAILPNL